MYLLETQNSTSLYCSPSLDLQKGRDRNIGVSTKNNQDSGVGENPSGHGEMGAVG